MKNKIGVIHGRFQPFHNDHLKYLLEAINRVDLLYIGITNPDPVLTLDDASDIKRSQLFANPCTYYERVLMVKHTLLDLGIDNKKFEIVPFPINFPELWKFYTPTEAIYFLTIYDDWGYKKKKLLSENGLNVQVLWERSESDKGITATDIRNRIIHNQEWHHLVPCGTADIINSNSICERIKKIHNDISNYL